MILLQAGCTTGYDQYNGISCGTAIRIAEQHSGYYSGRFRRVNRAEWDPEDKIWVVVLADNDGYHERIYKITRTGFLAGFQSITRGGGTEYAFRPGIDDYGPSVRPGGNDW